MNDRHLYKAKRTDNGEWVEGNLVWSEDADEEYRAVIIPIKNSYMYVQNSVEMENVDLGFERWHLVDPSTLCQYTGLTDKNSKEIWENDIVKYLDEIIGKYKIDIIKWNETYAAFVRLHKSEMGLQYLYINERIAAKCEVIGNIFDNPELLEGGAE